MCSSFSIFLSENPFASFAILTAFYVFFFLILRNCVKKHPLFIEKKDNSLDVLIVHAPSIDRFGFYGYDEFTFVKKRKGKYRIKLSRLSMIFLLLTFQFFSLLFPFRVSHSTFPHQLSFLYIQFLTSLHPHIRLRRK